MLVMRGVAVGALVIGLAACGGSDSAGPPDQKPDTTTSGTLRQVALNHNIRVGTAVDRLFKDDADGVHFKTIAAREFSALTAENDMKFDHLQKSHGVFSFARADSIVAWAESNNMQVRGHTLVWHSQLSSWVGSGTWTQAQATQIMKDHITAVMTHFKGHIVAWDVVNEAFNDDGTLRGTFWSNNVGADYIDTAFKTARAADPQALLFINDYNIEGINRKSDSLYAMVKAMQQRGVPIDGIGMQGHFQVGGLPSTQSMLDNIARFGALGLKVHFTEVDVRVPLPPTPTQLSTQGDDYRALFNVCLQSPACQMIVIWGLTDKETWIPNTFAGWGQPLLYDASFNPKIAYYSVFNLLSGK